MIETFLCVRLDGRELMSVIVGLIHCNMENILENITTGPNPTQSNPTYGWN